MFLLSSSNSAFASIDEDRRVMQLEHLNNHLISTAPHDLVKFLKEGFPIDVDWNAMPEFPAQKTDLYLYAIEELGRLREESAYPVIALLAQGESLPAVERIWERDLLGVRPADRARRREIHANAVEYNALVALGLLGNKKGIPILTEAFERRTDSRWRVQIVIALATLDDGLKIGWLVDQVGLRNRRESVAAAEALRLITGRDWGYSSTVSVKRRNKIADDVELWWIANNRSFDPVPIEIIRRRYFTPEAPLRSIPQSLPDLLEAATHIPDPGQRYHADYARTTLERMGPAITDELREIAMDEWEDIVIRGEAIRRLYSLEGKGAKGTLKKLRKDENAPIAELAQNLLEKL